MLCLSCWWFARRAVEAGRGSALALALGALASGGPLEVGEDHYFNHEYELAAEAFGGLLEREPGNPLAHARLAQALLHQELDRLRLLDTGAFRGDEEYYRGPRPTPDPRAGRRVLDTLRQGRLLCEQALRADESDRQALHALAQILALQANYQFMVSKAYFAALVSGKRAKAASERVGRLHPDFPDGLLVAGLHDYIVGSLPWPVRAAIALSGYRGNKKRGVATIERAAREGVGNRNYARALLALVLRRERRHLQAAREFEALGADFPRNYMFQLEAAAMYREAGERALALQLLRDAWCKFSSGEDRFERMPKRMAEALPRAIVRHQEELSESAGRSGGGVGRWPSSPRPSGDALVASGGEPLERYLLSVSASLEPPRPLLWAWALPCLASRRAPREAARLCSVPRCGAEGPRSRARRARQQWAATAPSGAPNHGPAGAGVVAWGASDRCPGAWGRVRRA